ncbi:MAG: hypothetical protein FWH53_00355 [Leptospirales bacterium]|nr:hypothetical protein [Leptospirales bacterium]
MRKRRTLTATENKVESEVQFDRLNINFAKILKKWKRQTLKKYHLAYPNFEGEPIEETDKVGFVPCFFKYARGIKNQNGNEWKYAIF